MINTKDLNTVLKELSGLTNKAGRLTKPEEHRFAYLQTAAAAIRAGASLAEIELEERGLPKPQPVKKHVLLTPEQEIEARNWQKFIHTPFERRTMTEGNLIAQLGTYTSLGYFVPTGFFPELKAALGYADALFDPNAVTHIATDNGRVTEYPLIGDIENVATLIGENSSSLTTVDYSAPSHASLGVYSFKSPAHTESMEAFQDTNVSDTFNAISNFKRIVADRLARGIGEYFVLGEGPTSSQPTGLLVALQALGLPPVIASGSAANDGLSETGVNSLGSQDFANAIAQLNQAYLESPKVAWFMNSATLAKVRGIVTKQGSLLELVKDTDDGPYIFGVKVRICPSMPNIGASNVPVILGDGSYFCTKMVQDETSGIKIYRESTGLIEQGLVQMVSYVRAGSTLLYNDTSSPAPFVMIQNHS